MPMITEALAEIKTIAKRITTKREFIGGYLARQEGVKDPLEKDGGSIAVIRQERQAIHDLESRIVALRRGIQHANETTVVTINGASRSIADWLTWRRDVVPSHRTFLLSVRDSLGRLRDKAKREGITVIPGGTPGEAQPTDFVVNIDERALAQEIEQLEDTLGQLDGQLSLVNATVPIQDYVVQEMAPPA